MKPYLHISTPGRICLFGDHQDYLGLPVIACAINRWVSLTAEENNTNTFEIDLPDIKAQRAIPIDAAFDTLEGGDFFASALRVVRRYGCSPKKGYNLSFESTVPINAGTSSSSAIVVAWIHFLIEAFGCDHDISPIFIAQLAYEAEVVEHHSPGGKMDQFTIGLGNIIYIETSEASSFETIGTQLEGLVLGVSGIPKETIGLLGTLKGKAQDAIAQVKQALPTFGLKETTVADIENLSHHISESLRPYFYAAIKNHEITQLAKREFQSNRIDYERVGRLMTEHHTVLKEVLKITVPRIDAMIDAAINAGAYGAKIVGSGGGGSIVALTPNHCKQAVVNAIKKAGAADAYEVAVVKGTQNKTD